ncbi:MAG: hypothetical protein FWD53_12585 [Phycisphaerales bacterium]|nr:hypothetical protein [Phycisphaerales bacterium]
MIRMRWGFVVLLLATVAFGDGTSDATLINKLNNSLRQRAAATRFKNFVSSSDLQKNTFADVVQSVRDGTGLDIRVDWHALKVAGLTPATAIKISGGGGRNLSYQQYLAGACKQLNVSLVLYFREPRG